MINEYLKYLQEGYFISDKDLSIDVDKFKSGEYNKLLIVGLSGSGKTTIGKQLAKKLNVKLRSTDDCPFNWLIYKNANRVMKDNLLNKYWDCCEKMIKDNKPGILEGVGLIETYWKRPNVRKAVLSYPCIILGASALKSSTRAAKRGDGNNFDLHFYETNFKTYQKMLTKFRKDRIKNDYTKES